MVITITISLPTFSPAVIHLDGKIDSQQQDSPLLQHLNITSSFSHNQVFPERIAFQVHLHRPADPFYRVSERPVIYQQHFKNQSFLDNSKTFQIRHTYFRF